MMNQKERRSHICKVSYCFANDVTRYEDIPGMGVIVDAPWKEIEHSSTEFSQNHADDATGTSQTIQISIPGNSLAFKQELEQIANSYCLVCLTYSTGDRVIVGSLSSPLHLLLSHEGNPIVYKLSCERLAAQNAPTLLATD